MVDKEIIYLDEIEDTILSHLILVKKIDKIIF